MSKIKDYLKQKLPINEIIFLFIIAFIVIALSAKCDGYI